jgi:hypothetical protein
MIENNESPMGTEKISVIRISARYPGVYAGEG